MTQNEFILVGDTIMNCLALQKKGWDISFKQAGRDYYLEFYKDGKTIEFNWCLIRELGKLLGEE